MKLTEANICVFDLETTGTDPAKDRIIQLCFWMGDEQILGMVDPAMPIPDEVQKLTRITNEVVIGQPGFSTHAEAIRELILRADALAGFGILRFDIPLLAEEFIRCGIDPDFLLQKPVIDAGVLFQVFEPRTLSAACQFYLGKQLDQAHTAGADVAATVQVLHAQIERYRLGDKSLAELETICLRDQKRSPDPAGKLMFDAQGRVCFATNRCKGVPVADEPGYAEWMLAKDFPESTKRVIRRELAVNEKPRPSLFDQSNQDEEGIPF